MFIVILLIVSQSKLSLYFAGNNISDEWGSSTLNSITPIPNDVDNLVSSSMKSGSFDTLEDNNENFLQNTFDYCDQFSFKNRNWCYEYAAYGLLEVDVEFYLERSVKICKKALASGLGDNCFNTLVNFSKLKFHPGSVEAIDYCSKLPSEWSEDCLELNKKL